MPWCGLIPDRASTLTVWWTAGAMTGVPDRSDRANNTPRKVDSSGALRPVGHQLELVGHSAKLRERTRLHLLHRPASMHFHRSFGDTDIVSDLFAQAAARHLNHDLALPRAQ